MYIMRSHVDVCMYMCVCVFVSQDNQASQIGRPDRQAGREGLRERQVTKFRAMKVISVRAAFTVVSD